jgi:hypothetical protein
MMQHRIFEALFLEAVFERFGGWTFWVFAFVLALVAYLVIGRLVFRNATAWRRIYFPLIDRYSVLGGAHVGMADKAGTDFTPKRPLAVLLKEYNPAWTAEEIELLLSKWTVDFESNHDFFDELFDKEVNRPSERSRKSWESIRTGEGRNSFFVRYVIGKLIESTLGSNERKAYWRAILKGDVS